MRFGRILLELVKGIWDLGNVGDLYNVTFEVFRQNWLVGSGENTVKDLNRLEGWQKYCVQTSLLLFGVKEMLNE